MNNETLDRWARTSLTAALLFFLIGAVTLLMGSAVEKAPTQCRGFEFSQATTPVQSGADSAVNFEIGMGPTASVLICNDQPSTNDSDVIVALSAATAAAPASTAASTSFRVRPGNQFNIDGRWTRCTLRGATANVTVRLIATY